MHAHRPDLPVLLVPPLVPQTSVHTSEITMNTHLKEYQRQDLKILATTNTRGKI